MFFTVLTKLAILLLFWVRLIQLTPSHKISLKFTLILFSHIRLCLPNRSFISVFPSHLHNTLLLPSRPTLLTSPPSRLFTTNSFTQTETNSDVSQHYTHLMLCPRPVFSPHCTRNCSVRQTHTLTATQPTTVPVSFRSSRRILPAAGLLYVHRDVLKCATDRYRSPVWQTACWRKGVVLGRVHIEPYCCCYHHHHHHHHHHHRTALYRIVQYSRISMFVDSLFEISTFRGRRFTIIFLLPLGSEKQGKDHEAGGLLPLPSLVSCSCPDHSQLSKALSFTKWRWLFAFHMNPGSSSTI